MKLTSQFVALLILAASNIAAADTTPAPQCGTINVDALSDQELLNLAKGAGSVLPRCNASCTDVMGNCTLLVSGVPYTTESGSTNMSPYEAAKVVRDLIKAGACY